MREAPAVLPAPDERSVWAVQLPPKWFLTTANLGEERFPEFVRHSAVPEKSAECDEIARFPTHIRGHFFGTWLKFTVPILSEKCEGVQNERRIVVLQEVRVKLSRIKPASDRAHKKSCNNELLCSYADLLCVSCDEQSAKSRLPRK